MTNMPEPQRLTYIRLFQVCGDLWAKELPKDPRLLAQLHREVIEAICLTELHLPALMADIKLHGLLHLSIDNIPMWGKCMGVTQRISQDNMYGYINLIV